MNPDRRARKQARHRIEILEAAARAFASKGLDATTVQDIAAEAGYGAATLYSYFTGKQEIVDGLLEHLAHEMLATFEVPAPSGTAFRQRLEHLVRTQLSLADRRRGELAVFLVASQTMAVSRTRHERARAGFLSFAARMTSWVKANAAPGDLRGCPVETAALFILSALHMSFIRWAIEQSSAPLAASARTIVQLLLHGLSGPPTTEPIPSLPRSTS
ncbi:MAG: TetR/AcrR family transcriptional regulator [Myxococcota bacterium]